MYTGDCTRFAQIAYKSKKKKQLSKFFDKKMQKTLYFLRKVPILTSTNIKIAPVRVNQMRFVLHIYFYNISCTLMIYKTQQRKDESSFRCYIKKSKILF